MKVLVVGSGGREHALAWKISQSDKVKKIYAAPGNAGISKIATCIPIKADDIASLLSFARQESIDLTVVGPEAPLAAGIGDAFREAGLTIFGPSKSAAQIESSKIFAKKMMDKYGIPTGEAHIFDNPRDAIGFVKDRDYPVVIKADGLAAGKGVVVVSSPEEARDAIRKMMIDRVFGQAGERILIEEFLEGEEASFLALTDGRNVLSLPLARDYKRVYDGDRGPNTGGMGSYSPVPSISDDTYRKIETQIIIPIIEALNAEGYPYEGVIYAGLMITEDGPKVLEFNCRFGDPETQPLLMRMNTDLIEIIEVIIRRKLDKIRSGWSEKAATCVVLASGGYPGKYEKGKVITGLDEVEGMEDIEVFHAGTAIADGKVVTAGGRVLGVTALGSDIRDAALKAYKAIEKIHFEGMHYRKDIGLNREC